MANPGPNITVTSNIIQENVPADGHQLGSSALAAVGFWGAVPVVQPKGATQAAITDSSGGTANAATGVAVVGASYSQTVLANALATIIAQTNAIQAALVAAGLMKGSA